MFYVSKIEAPATYYITDTKDGVSEPYNLSQIQDMVINMGLTILGVAFVGSQFYIHPVSINVDVTPSHLDFLMKTYAKSQSEVDKIALDWYLTCLRFDTKFRIGFADRQTSILFRKVSNNDWTVDNQVLSQKGVLMQLRKFARSPHGFVVYSV